jgi:hypothetical protein
VRFATHVSSEARSGRGVTEAVKEAQSQLLEPEVAEGEFGAEMSREYDSFGDELERESVAGATSPQNPNAV